MVRLVPVTDPADPRIADYRDVRERDLVGRRGAFVAEGEVVLSVLLRSSFHRPTSLLIDERRVAALAPMLETIDAAVPVHVAPRAVLDTIVGFPLHRGILALGRKGDEEPAGDLLARLPDDAVVVVALGIANHDNIGGIFRNAAAFGAAAVLIDDRCCDPFYRKALRVSVGHVLSVPSARIPSDEDPVALLARHGFEALSLSPKAAERLVDIAPRGRVAALLGTEGPGLSDDVLARTRAVSIPMAAGVDSLNVAVTSGIVLHHLTARRTLDAASRR
ncbi:MAG: RNA methyltransferase [Hyphomicrobiales bacterium]|nr:RNA methyltransferase [Hyphomicrobiales bacterium]